MSEPKVRPGRKRLGRGLEDFSDLFFSSGATAPAPAAEPPPRAEVRPSGGGALAGPAVIRTVPEPAHPARPGEPRTLFVTGFRAGGGKSMVAAAIARECTRVPGVSCSWQLGPGVIVPRQGNGFGLPIPHPSDPAAFEKLLDSWRHTTALILDGPLSLVGDGDPFVLAAAEFLVVAVPGPEGTAEGYAAVKEIVGACPGAAIRVLVNHAASQDEAREVFQRINDVSRRYLGRPVRSYGGLPTLVEEGAEGASADREARSILFSRIARGLVLGEPEPGSPPYFEAVRSRLLAEMR